MAIRDRNRQRPLMGQAISAEWEQEGDKALAKETEAALGQAAMATWAVGRRGRLVAAEMAVAMEAIRMIPIVCIQRRR